MRQPPDVPVLGTLNITLGEKEPRPIYTNYIFVQVIYNQRGAVKYDWILNHFVLYLKLEEIDYNRCPALAHADVSEVWLSLKGKETRTVN